MEAEDKNGERVSGVCRTNTFLTPPSLPKPVRNTKFTPIIEKLIRESFSAFPPVNSCPIHAFPDQQRSVCGDQHVTRRDLAVNVLKRPPRASPGFSCGYDLLRAVDEWNPRCSPLQIDIRRSSRTRIFIEEVEKCLQKVDVEACSPLFLTPAIPFVTLRQARPKPAVKRHLANARPACDNNSVAVYPSV